MVEEKKKEETKAVEEKAERKIEVSFNLGELEDIGIFLSSFASPGELRRVGNARKMLEQKILEIVGIEVGSKEFKEMARLRRLVSSDPETSRLIRNATETYSRVYGMRVTMDFSTAELKSMIDASKGEVHGGGVDVDGLRRKLSEAYNKTLSER